MLCSTPLAQVQLKILNQHNTSRASINMTPITAIEDDELQRKNRRSLASMQKRVQTSIEGSPTVNLSVVYDIGEVEDHFKLCFKLFNENKINSKNAWDLKIIDYMRTLLLKDVLGKDTMLIAAMTLDICSKVYACRVDDLHSEGLKLASALVRLHSKPQEDGAQEEQNEPNAENQGPKKKNKRRRLSTSKACTVGDPNTICGSDIPKLASTFFVGHISIDSSNIDNMYTIKSPMDHFDCEFMLLNKVTNGHPTCDEVDPVVCKNDTYPSMTIAMTDLKICAPFAGFHVDEWDPEQEEALIACLDTVDKPNPINEELVYDEHGIPIAELDGSIHDIFAEAPQIDQGSDEDEICADRQVGNREIEMVVSFGPSNKNRKVDDLYNTSDYHKLFESFMKRIWSGPSHWKNKMLLQTVPRFTGKVVGQTMPKSTKKKIIPPQIAFGAMTPLDFQKKYKPMKIKLYSSKCTLPLHLPISLHDVNKLFTKPVKSKGEYHGKPIDEFEHSPYDYENPNDSQYISQSFHEDVENNNEPLNVEHTQEEGIIDGCKRNSNFQDNLVDVDHNDQTAAVMSNLVDAPDMVAQEYIPYALRAKKMNMKKLKTIMWDVLIKDKTDNVMVGEATISKTFRQLYDELHEKLPQAMQKELSPHLAFVALLHLANEHNLKLTGQKDLSDMIIESIPVRET